MEALCCLLKRAVEGNFLTGCKFEGREGGGGGGGGEGEEVIISHLLYVDDIV